MGLFSSKKKTYVSISTYNMAGDPEQRIDFLRQTVFNSVLSGTSVGTLLTDEILAGQSMRFRQGLRYANSHYAGGMPNVSIQGAQVTNTQAVVDSLAPRFPSYTITVDNALTSTPQFDYWAEDYLEKNYNYDSQTKQMASPPKGVAVNAKVMTELVNGRIQIQLINPGQSSPAFTHSFVPDNFSATAQYVHAIYRMHRTNIVRDDTKTRDTVAGDADSTTTSTSTVEAIDESYTEHTVVTVTVAGGVTKTRTKVDRTIQTRGKYFMYRVGTGTYPALDAVVSSVTKQVQCLPAIPLRVDNKDMGRKELRSTAQYKTSKTLLKRLGMDMADLVDSLNDNEDIKDIDFAYVVMGVELAGKSAAEQEYVFRFLNYLSNNQVAQNSAYDSWVAANPGASIKNAPPLNTFTYANTGAKDTYNSKFQWNSIKRTLKAGNIGNVGTYKVTCGAFTQKTFGRGRIGQAFADAVADLTPVTAQYQVSANVIEEIVAVGLTMESLVYNGKTVTVKAYDAFNDPEEDGQGFILPLLLDVYRDMGAINQARLGRVSCHMALYCYQVVKVKWYQRGVFKVIMVIVAVAIAYFSAGTGSGVSATIIAGLTGAGVSVVMATLIAAVANVLVSSILMNVLSEVSVKLFGEKWGGVIATIISIAVTRKMANLGNTAANMHKLTATTLINNLGAVVKVYGAYTQGAVLELQSEFEKMQKEYEDQMDLHRQAMLDLNSGLMLDLDMLMATDFQLFHEKPEDFLTRTLMVGSDVVDITLGSIYDFAETGTTLPT